MSFFLIRDHKHEISPLMGFVFLTVFAAFLLPDTCQATGTTYGDVTSRLELLGNPYEFIYLDHTGQMRYARNIWDMQAFEGKLYIGAGNSSNIGPASNAGPVPIISFNPQTDEFTEEFVVDDEQIDLFHVIDGAIYVPGHDPKEGWEWGNFYRMQNEGWEKYRNIPNGIHNYGMTGHGNHLFAALGTKRGAAVSVSSDDGKTWENHPVNGFRTHSFIECRERLFAAGLFSNLNELIAKGHSFDHWPQHIKDGYIAAPISEWDGATFVSRPDLGIEAMLPGIAFPENRLVAFKLVKPLVFKGAAIYIGGQVHNDHQFLPIGLFAARNLDPDGTHVEPLNLGEDQLERQIWDIVERNGILHALTAHPLPGNGYRVEVMRSSNLKTWTQVLSFESPTFARSFELLEGVFYFGLGDKVAEPHPRSQTRLSSTTGQILQFDPKRSAESLLIGDLIAPGPMMEYLAKTARNPDEDIRDAGYRVLRAFVNAYDPDHPRRRDGFMKRMTAIFQDHDATDHERLTAFRMLLLHSYVDPDKLDEYLAWGAEDDVVEIRDIAMTIQLVGLKNEHARQLIRWMQEQTSVDIQNAAVSQAFRRESHPFPDGADERQFELVASFTLPKSGWWFRRDPNVATGMLEKWYAPDRIMHGWTPCEIGQVWAEFLDEKYVGVGWYRLQVDIPPMGEFDSLALHFGGVDEHAWVWVNGHFAGQHDIGPRGWNKPFQLDVSKLLKPGQPNQITVRVMNTAVNGGIWKPVELHAYRRR